MSIPAPRKSKKPPHGTTHSHIYGKLRSALMNGDFVPGQRLVVRDLAERFNTSPMPVREALRRLVSEEALFDHPNRGVLIPEATVAVISDLVRVRCSIEGSAAEWAATTITTDEIDEAENINGRMQAIANQPGSGVRDDYLALNRQFHFLIYRASRSPVLLPIIERLWLRAGPWLNIMRQGTTLGMGLDHHTEILDALHKGEGLRARRAVVADISDAADIMLRAANRGIPDLTGKPNHHERKKPAARRQTSSSG